MTASEKELIIGHFKPLFGGTGGIDSWITDDVPSELVERLGAIDASPLKRSQLNQLLVLSGEAPVSQGFFDFYWCEKPEEHPYDVDCVDGYQETWRGTDEIVSLDHLKWGLTRFYIDALMYFGNIRQAYRELRRLDSLGNIRASFQMRQINTKALVQRGPPLPFEPIAKDERYLISEMACKSYQSPVGETGLWEALKEAFEAHSARGGGRVKIKSLLDGSYVKGKSASASEPNQMHMFSANAMLDDEVETLEELRQRYERVAASFAKARKAALQNTRLYLSMMSDLDVYVATSMRRRDDFRKMASTCERIFSTDKLRSLNLRYFDPTMSACDGHEDKGLIECLAVKCAKVLLYSAGEKESYGKDAEAAMALSQGKPVIFLCDEEQRSRFYRDVHPLSRLIDFDSGTAVGAMVTSDPDQASELLYRLFTNQMSYKVEQPRDGFLRLKERVTGSVVRLQTSDSLLRETFWNHYHNRV